MRGRVGGDVDADGRVFWVDECWRVGEGVFGGGGWCVFWDCEDVELGDQGEGDAAISGHFGGGGGGLCRVYRLLFWVVPNLEMEATPALELKILAMGRLIVGVSAIARHCNGPRFCVACLRDTCLMAFQV